MDSDTQTRHERRLYTPSFPAEARLPINRCNLPAVILGSLTFQRHPTALLLDGITPLHAELFLHLDGIGEPQRRAQRFMDYMSVHFRLEALEDAGLDAHTRHRRDKANYLRTVRGWFFDADSREGAVLKGWVESRFGLLPRHHGGSIHSTDTANYLRYAQERATGLYNTNALEAQLDLLYTYCQYELTRRLAPERHLLLFRGMNHLEQHDMQECDTRGHFIALLNNLNSFTDDRERADEFGDAVVQARVPLAKVLFYSELLPGMLKGEREYLVIGGMYELQRVTS